MTDDDKTPVSVDPVAKWDRRFRRNRAERERALRREAGKPPSLPDADFDEISERIEALERKKSIPAPGKLITAILAAVTDWRRLTALALVLAALVALAWKFPAIVKLLSG